VRAANTLELIVTVDTHRVLDDVLAAPAVLEQQHR
jgi:hypothetical protein